MNDLEALHARLDLTPQDAALRLAIADYLDEHGGGLARLAPGYRALGFRRRCATRHDRSYHSYSVDPRKALSGGKNSGPSWEWWSVQPKFWSRVITTPNPQFPSHLVHAWFGLIPVEKCYVYGPKTEDYPHGISKDFYSRRDADDAAALAFSFLPAHTRAEILGPYAEVST